MDAAAFIADLRARNFAVYSAGNALYVTPTSKLTPGDVARIKEAKTAMLAVLNAPKPMPSLRDGSLHIGFDCDPLFQWWKPEGQTIAQTLADLDAPAATVRRYTELAESGLHAGLQQCDSKPVEIEQVRFCPVCGWREEIAAANPLKDYLGF